MIDHTARSREDAVPLSLSDSLYHRGRLPTPAHMSFFHGSNVKKPFQVVQTQDEHVKVESLVKYAESTQYFNSVWEKKTHDSAKYN